MWNWGISSVVVLAAVAGTALSSEPKQPQDVSVGGKRGGPPKELTVDLGRGVKMELVLIPAGTFMMGDEKGWDAEKPVHKVTITKPFYLGKFEVTQEEWQAVMDNNPSHLKGPKHPVEMVSWKDCQGFVAQLNEKFLSAGAKFGLPTEAQWEYACRAGTTTQWCFGDDAVALADYAWWDTVGDSIFHHSVGQKKPNAWGLYDMHGNVWEWCADRWAEDYYGKSPTMDPMGPESGDFRVYRGGWWPIVTFPELFRSAVRYYDLPEFRDPSNGFRVARTATP